MGCLRVCSIGNPRFPKNLLSRFQLRSVCKLIHPVNNEFDECIANAPSSIEPCLSHVTSSTEYPNSILDCLHIPPHSKIVSDMCYNQCSASFSGFVLFASKSTNPTPLLKKPIFFLFYRLFFTDFTRFHQWPIVPCFAIVSNSCPGVTVHTE